MSVTEEKRRAVLALSAHEASALRRAASALGPFERTHLLLRYASAPWARVVEALEPSGSLVDIGCGPGLLAHLLARAGFTGDYLGLDPDPRKIARARRWLAESPGRRFQPGSAEEASEGAFSQAALLDVLYLVSPRDRDPFVSRVGRALAPGGLLVVLTSGGGPRWKRSLDALQERIAVGLGITRGDAVATCDGAEVAERLARAGLEGISVEAVGRGHAHGFELVTARRPSS